MNSSVRGADVRVLAAGRAVSRDSGWPPSVVSVVVRLTPRATLTRLPSSSISISVRPVSSRSAASSRTRSLSKVPSFLVIGGVHSLPPSAWLDGGEPRGKRLDRKLVALGPKAADHTLYRLRDIRVLAERLAREDVRQVHLDRGDRAGE